MSKRKTDKEFKKEIAHLPLYTTDTYKGYGVELTFTCKKCGYKWDEIPKSILGGYGCPICNKPKKARKRKTDKEFKKEIAHLPFNTTDTYKGYGVKLKFTCDKCKHTWKATPVSILNGSGCPFCATSGYNPKKEGYFYLYNIDNSFLGFGITNNIEARHKTHMRNLKKARYFNPKLIGYYKFNGEEVQKIEKYFKEHFDITPLECEGFKTECTYLSNIDEAKSILERYSSLRSLTIE